jgi:hypothetical protein
MNQPVRLRRRNHIYAFSNRLSDARVPLIQNNRSGLLNGPVLHAGDDALSSNVPIGHDAMQRMGNLRRLSFLRNNKSGIYYAFNYRLRRSLVFQLGEIIDRIAERACFTYKLVILLFPYVCL